MKNVRYKEYLISSKFLINQVNYVVIDKYDFEFTLVPNDDSFELTGRDKLKENSLSPEFVREISNFICSFNE
jgi:hypothetical protein